MIFATVNERFNARIKLNNMENWIKTKTTATLKDGDSRIISVTKLDNGRFEFQECCDNWFSEVYTKEDAISLIDELKEWINSN